MIVEYVSVQPLTRRRLVGLALGAGITSLLASCAPAAPSSGTAPGTPSAKPSVPAAKSETSPIPTGGALNIGVPVNLTGGLALLGIPIRDAVQMGTDEINEKGGIGGRKLALLIEDAASTNDAGENAVRKILSQKPIAIVGLPLSNQVLASMNTLKESHVPSLVFGTNPTIGPSGKPSVFQVQANNDIAVQAATQFLVGNLGKKKAAVIHTNDENGISAAKAFQATVDKNGLKGVADESYALGDKDVSAQLLKIKNSGADGIVSWADQAGAALVIRQSKQLGISISIISNTLVSATLELLTEDELTGQYIAFRALPAFDPDPRIKNWADAYKKRFNRDADEYAAMAYDSLKLIAEAIEKGGPTPDAITNYIATVKGFQGICCPLKADQQNGLSRQMVIARLKGKTPEPIARVEV